MRLSVIVLCGLAVVIGTTASTTADVAIRLKRYAPNRQWPAHTDQRGDDLQHNGRNVDTFGQDFISLYGARNYEVNNFGENKFKRWQNYIPNHGNYNPSAQNWQMFVPQNGWHGQYENHNGYHYPNYGGQPGDKPWNYNQGGYGYDQHPSRPGGRPPRPWNPYHHPWPHHHAQHPELPEFPDCNQNPEENSSNVPDETTSSPVFPTSSKPPDASDANDNDKTGNEGLDGGNEKFDIDIRSGFTS